jgi:hypothetical protein
MAALRLFAVLPLAALVSFAQTADFRNVTWGMDRAQVIAKEGIAPSQIREFSGETVARYDSAQIGGLDCRVVYIFAKDKLVRTKYVFQQEHAEKNDFLADFALLDAFLIGSIDRPSEQRVSWRNEEYKADPKRYGAAVSLGHLLYSTQWSSARTIVTHALSGENGAIVHEIEYVSVDLEPWEDQIVKEQRAPAGNAPKRIETAAAP